MSNKPGDSIKCGQLIIDDQKFEFLNVSDVRREINALHERVKALEDRMPDKCLECGALPDHHWIGCKQIGKPCPESQPDRCIHDVMIPDCFVCYPTKKESQLACDGEFGPSPGIEPTPPTWCEHLKPAFDLNKPHTLSNNHEWYFLNHIGVSISGWKSCPICATPRPESKPQPAASTNPNPPEGRLAEILESEHRKGGAGYDLLAEASVEAVEKALSNYSNLTPYEKECIGNYLRKQLIGEK